MNPSDLLIALVMLGAPVGTPETISDDRWPEMSVALAHKAVELEILDPRETNHIFKTHNDFQVDLDIVRRRFHKFNGQPMLADVNRFPDKDIINRYMQFNREFRNYLSERLRFEPDRADLLERAIAECDQYYKLWDQIRDTKATWQYVSYRRDALLCLKNKLGENFDLPPYVPEWALN